MTGPLSPTSTASQQVPAALYPGTPRRSRTVPKAMAPGAAAALALVLAAAARPAAAQTPPAVADPTAVVTYSQLTWAVCSTADPLQQFDVDEASGLWKDKETGRCMSVLDKQQPAVAGGNWAKVVLAECGGSFNGVRTHPLPPQRLIVGGASD